MRRRAILAVVSAAGMSRLAGCVGILTDCPAEPIVDDSIPASRRSLRFLPDEASPEDIEVGDPPTIQFDRSDATVTVRGVMSGSPRSEFKKNMIVVDRLTYSEPEDTLWVRLRERQCKSHGAGVMDVSAYELRVEFSEGLPGTVCAQEGGGSFEDEANDKRRCVSR